MFEIIRYNFINMIRSKWAIVYGAFFFLSCSGIFYFSSEGSKAVMSLLNIVIGVVPLISCILGVVYYYNSREFIELLIVQPVKRSKVLMGIYLGMNSSLILSFSLGMIIPAILFGGVLQESTMHYFLLIFIGIIFTLIFTGLSFWVSLKNNDRIKGIGKIIGIWLLLSVIYDGLLLILLVILRSYPIEKMALIATIFNPIDLGRIMISLQLDIAALMGFTGALFKNFLGNSAGSMIVLSVLLLWIIIPQFFILRILKKKDF